MRTETNNSEGLRGYTHKTMLDHRRDKDSKRSEKCQKNQQSWNGGEGHTHMGHLGHWKPCSGV